MSKSLENVKNAERKDVNELVSSKVVNESEIMAEQSLNLYQKLVKLVNNMLCRTCNLACSLNLMQERFSKILL